MLGGLIVIEYGQGLICGTFGIFFSTTGFSIVKPEGGVDLGALLMFLASLTLAGYSAARHAVLLAKGQSMCDRYADIKRRLEIAGVDYAAYHDILYKKVRLPSNTRLYEYKLSAMERCMMDMKLNEFPVCVQHGDLTIKMAAHHESAVSVLVRKIEDKLLISPIKHCIILAGEDLYSI